MAKHFTFETLEGGVSDLVTPEGRSKIGLVCNFKLIFLPISSTGNISATQDYFTAFKIL